MGEGDLVVQTFVWLGLSVLQAKVYVALVEGGVASVEVLSRRTKVCQLDVKCALGELQNLGLVKVA